MRAAVGFAGRVRLADLADLTARSDPERIALESSVGEPWSYERLVEAARDIAGRLRAHGVGPGDRVALHAAKTPDTVAALFGILKAGAAYVPIDPDAPPGRAAFIAADCGVSAVIADPERLERMVGEGEGTGFGLAETCGPFALALAAEAPPPAVAPPADLAFVLYTSGSTGLPKGVMITESAALSFVDWCRQTFEVGPEDRCSSHAPFHFDLSVFDLFVCLGSGGTLVLINSILARLPLHLARFAEERRITVWYSTPSALTLFLTSGALARHDLSALRVVLFAGEVFPIKHLRQLRRALPKARMFNLYGPTETNVCTWFEVPDLIEDDRTDPLPIGVACAHLRTRVEVAEGRSARPGEEGELMVAGAGVMAGYWNRPEATSRAWAVDAAGTRWYRTGDFVREDAQGRYLFVGRRDRMVKRRGYRIELAEIEAALYRHPAVSAAAVIARDHDGQPVVEAFVECVGPEGPEELGLRSFCGTQLPHYMCPDTFVRTETLPRTPTDKVDYRHLAALRETASTTQPVEERPCSSI